MYYFNFNFIISSCLTGNAAPAASAPTPAAAPAATNGDDSWGSSAPASSAPSSDGFGSSGFSSGGFGGGFSGGSAEKTATNVLFVGGLSFNTDENGLQAGDDHFFQILKILFKTFYLLFLF
jgi:hypothetical protein